MWHGAENSARKTLKKQDEFEKIGVRDLEYTHHSFFQSNNLECILFFKSNTENLRWMYNRITLQEEIQKSWLFLYKNENNVGLRATFKAQ